jgi:hypothetical protein
MIIFTVLISFGCVLFFAAGIIAGFALRNRRIAVLVKTNGELSETNETIGKSLEVANVNHSALVNEHRTLYDLYNQLRKNLSERDLEHRKLAEASAADREAIGDYEKAAFEYADKLQQLDSVQKENNVLSLQVAVQKKRIAELEDLVRQVDRFEEIAAYARELEAQNGKLRDEIAMLKSIGVKPIPFTNVQGFKTISSRNTIEDVCKKILASTTAHRNNHGAAISDDMGFVIVASSDYADELAGISVVHHYCEKILNSNIPFGNVTKITIKNSNNLFLTVMPFIINGQMVFYSGLSQGPIEVGLPAGKVTGALVVN